MVSIRSEQNPKVESRKDVQRDNVQSTKVVKMYKGTIYRVQRFCKDVQRDNVQSTKVESGEKLEVGSS